MHFPITIERLTAQKHRDSSTDIAMEEREVSSSIDKKSVGEKRKVRAELAQAKIGFGKICSINLTKRK